MQVEWLCEDLQDFLKLTHTKKDVLFIIGDLNVKVESQEIPGVTGKFGLGVQNEAGKRLTEFCQENIMVIANTLFQQYKRCLSWLQSPSAMILEPKKIKSVTVSTVSPSICHEVLGPDVMILVF